MFSSVFDMLFCARKWSILAVVRTLSPSPNLITQSLFIQRHLNLKQNERKNWANAWFGSSHSTVDLSFTCSIEEEKYIRWEYLSIFFSVSVFASFAVSFLFHLIKYSCNIFLCESANAALQKATFTSSLGGRTLGTFHLNHLQNHYSIISFPF